MSYRVLRGQFCSGVMACLCLAGFSLPAQGDPISYSTEAVAFEIDYDPIFGTPDPNSLVSLFEPPDFEASCLSGEFEADQTSGTLTVTMTALDDWLIDTVTFWEDGDYTLMKGCGQEMNARVKASLFAHCLFLQADGHDVTTIDLDRTVIFGDNVTFEPDDPPEKPWTSEYVVDIAGALAGAGIEGGATKVIFLINNVLLAKSDTTASASIDKNHFDIDVTVVPEPSSLVLLMLGCCALLAFRSCRRT